MSSSRDRTIRRCWALYLGLLDADFEITDSPEMVAAPRNLAARYQRAIQASQLVPDQPEE